MKTRNFCSRFHGRPYDGHARPVHKRQVDLEQQQSRRRSCRLVSGPPRRPPANQRHKNGSGRPKRRRPPTEEVPMQNVPTGKRLYRRESTATVAVFRLSNGRLSSARSSFQIKFRCFCCHRSFFFFSPSTSSNQARIAPVVIISRTFSLPCYASSAPSRKRFSVFAVGRVKIYTVSRRTLIELPLLLSH